MKPVIEEIDENTYALYLEVPGSRVVQLQSFFECYEGVGIVRTLDIRKSLVCILTTEPMLPDCLKILEDLQDRIPWRCPEAVSAEDKQHFLGYFKEGRYD